MTDRTSKILLTLIAIALWGLLLRPFISLPPAQAQSSDVGPASSKLTTVIPYEGKPLVVIHGGKISVWTVTSGAARASLVLNDQESLP